MQILIAGHIDFDPRIAESMLVEARPLIEAALAEPGCRAYSWALDPLKPGRVCVFEKWDNEHSLAAHFASAPYREMGAHLAAAGMLGFEVLKYRVDLAEPVYDPNGMPRADFSVGESEALIADPVKNES